MEFQNQAILWSEPELVGWVEKRGETSWNRRFFLLQGAFIFYYIKNNDIRNTEPTGVIPLEGATFKDEEDSESGRRFCFLLQLGPELAGFAKRPRYHISTPSHEAKVVWMHALQMASYPLSQLLEELQVFREKTSDLETQLAKSPKNLEEMEHHHSHESRVIQKEIKRVTKAYKLLKKETLEACAEADKVNKEVVQALATWEIYTDYISGRNHESKCSTMDRLNDEASLTDKLLKLLTKKRQLLSGEGIDKLSSEALHDLEVICNQGLKNIMERQFQVRIKGPRYTSSVHPKLLPVGLYDPVFRVPHAFDISDHKRKSSGSFHVLKESELKEKQKKNSGKGKILLQNLKNDSQENKLEDFSTPKKSNGETKLNKDYTIVEVEDELHEIKSKPRTFSKIKSDELGHEIDSNIEVEAPGHGIDSDIEVEALGHQIDPNIEVEALDESLEQSIASGLQKQEAQDRLNRAPNSSSKFEDPAFIESMTKKPFKLKSIDGEIKSSKKRVSFSQPNILEENIIDGFDNFLLNNSSKASFGNSICKALNPNLVLPSTLEPSHFQLLTQPQWVQVRPQTFNIVGPASIHTHDGGSSATPKFEICNRQEKHSENKQEKQDEYFPLDSILSNQVKNQNHHAPSCYEPNKETYSCASKFDEYLLEKQKNLFDGSMKIDLYNSKENQCSPSPSSNDSDKPTKGENNDRGSMMNQESSKKSCTRYPSPILKRNDRSKNTNEHSEVDAKMSKEEGTSLIIHGRDHYLQRKENKPIQSIIKKQYPNDTTNSPTQLVRNQHQINNQVDYDVETIKNQNNYSDEGNNFNQFNTKYYDDFDAQQITKHETIRYEEIPMSILRNLQSLEDKISILTTIKQNSELSKKINNNPSIGPISDGQFLINEKGIEDQSRIKRQLIDDKIFPLQLSSDEGSLENENFNSISSKNNQKILLRQEQSYSNQPFNNWTQEDNLLLQSRRASNLLQEEESLPIQSKSIQPYMNRKRSDPFESNISNHLSNEEDKTCLPPRAYQYYLGRNNDLPLELKNNQSLLQEETRSILKKPNNLKLQKNNEDICIETNNNWPYLKREVDARIPLIGDEDKTRKKSTLAIESKEKQYPPIKTQSPYEESKLDHQSPLHNVPKIAGYVENIVPSKLRALFQRMQPKLRNDCASSENNQVKPIAVIFSGMRKEVGPHELHQNTEVFVPTMSQSSKETRNQKHVKWTKLQEDPRISLPSTKQKNSPKNKTFSHVKRAKSQECNVLPSQLMDHIYQSHNPISPPQNFENLRSQSDIQHLLRSHSRVENTIDPSLTTKKTCDHQIKKVKSPRHHRRDSQCTSPSLKHHHCHHHKDCICPKPSSTDEFKKKSQQYHANRGQTSPSHPQQCLHHCQHHHHNQGTSNKSQEQDLCSFGFHDKKTPIDNRNDIKLEDCNDGWFSPSHSKKKH